MKTILIVEDQQDVQRLLGVALKHDSRRILHCLDAEDAWRMMQEERPDLVLLDIMMPGKIDGLDLLRMLRADQRFDTTRVIVISARTQEWDRDAALGASADAFIGKPFRLDILKKVVAENLG